MVEGSFSPRGMSFSGFEEENCNESQIGYLRMKIIRIESDAENQMKNVMEMVETIYERLEKDLGIKGQLHDLKAELEQMKERGQQNRKENENLKKLKEA